MKLNLCILLLVLTIGPSSVSAVLCTICKKLCDQLPLGKEICHFGCTATVCKGGKRALTAFSQHPGRHEVPMALDWNAYDLNEDDVISLDELAVATSVELTDPGLSFAFKTADTNGDGVLSKQEFYSGPFLFESDMDGEENEWSPMYHV